MKVTIIKSICTIDRVYQKLQNTRLNSQTLKIIQIACWKLDERQKNTIRLINSTSNFPTFTLRSETSAITML